MRLIVVHKNTIIDNMPVRKCNTCKKTFIRKSAYTYHIHRKYKCEPVEEEEIDDDIEAEERRCNICNKLLEEDGVCKCAMPKKINAKVKEFKCINCNKIFSRMGNLNKHIKQQICYTEEEKKGKIMLDRVTMEVDKYKKKLIECENEIKEHRLMLNKLMNVNKNNNADIKNTDANTNTENTLVNCGEEDLSNLSSDKIIECMKGGYLSIIYLTMAIHFDPNHPKNHNVYKQTKANNSVTIYNNGWKSIDVHKFIDNFYEEKKKLVQKYMEEYNDQLLPFHKNILNQLIKQTDQNKIKNTKMKLLSILHDNKDMII